jgi:hypothetical protein
MTDHSELIPSITSNVPELRRFALRKTTRESMMKMLPFVSIVILSLCASAQGQTAGKAAVSVDAQNVFDQMKTLAGTWQGPIMVDDPAWATDKPMSLSIRVASHGNALIHELNTGGPEVTVFYVDNDRLALIHYCDFGNRPHLEARPSADGKTVEFDLVDAPGSNQVGHVSHAVFTMIDANHHIEDWTFTLANGKPLHAHMDFNRVQ